MIDNIINNDHIYKKKYEQAKIIDQGTQTLNFAQDYTSIVYDNAQKISISPVILNGKVVDKYLSDILTLNNYNPNQYFFISYSDTSTFNGLISDVKVGMTESSLEDLDTNIPGNEKKYNNKLPYLIYKYKSNRHLIIVPLYAGFLIKKNTFKVITFNLKSVDIINANEYVLMSHTNQYNFSQNPTWAPGKEYHINTVFTYDSRGYIVSVSKLSKSQSFSKDDPFNIKIIV